MALANLNELELAVSILDSYERSSVSVTLKDLRSSLTCSLKVLAGSDGMTLLNSSSSFSKFSPDFASDKIETFLHPTKGRGIREIDAMPKGSLILIESPLSYSSTNAVEEHSISLTLDKERTIHDKSQTLLESTMSSKWSTISF
jgi:hypothetical protein